MIVAYLQTLIHDFVDGRISVAEFEDQYLAAWPNLSLEIDEWPFQILETLWFSIDDYWEGCAPGDEDEWTISEDRLRQFARDALTELDRGVRGSPGNEVQRQ